MARGFKPSETFVDIKNSMFDKEEFDGSILKSIQPEKYDRNMKIVCNGGDDLHVGVAAARFPAGNGLRGDTQRARQCLLRASVSMTQLPYFTSYIQLHFCSPLLKKLPYGKLLA